MRRASTGGNHRSIVRSSHGTLTCEDLAAIQLLRLFGAVFTAAIILMFVKPASGQAPQPDKYSPSRYDFIERRGIRVPMRDGAQLAVDMYIPSASEKLPAVLTITPYGRTDL